MKLKNGIYGMLAIGMIFTAKTAGAVIYADQAVVASSSDDENEDAISRFGSDATKRKSAAVAKPLDPISENSFEQEHSRSPASVSEDGRSPAGVTAAPAKAPVVDKERRAKSYQEIAVIANDTGFYPSTVFLTQGIPVRIYLTGASAKSQCFMLDQFGVRRQVRSQKIEEITFVPDQVGTFTFNCPMNGAKGTVIVKELDLAEQRVPASTPAEPVVEARSERAPTAKRVENKTPDIRDEDFTPEFRK